MMKQVFLGFAALCLALPASAQLGREKPAKADPAIAAYIGGDYATALDLSRQACTTIETSGCALAGDILRKGLVEAQDYAGAAAAYDKGCDGGDARACAALGNLKVRGVDGVPQDFPGGEAAYRRACELGSTNGCAGLGNLLLTALRGPLTRDEGVSLLRKTCRDGFAYSCEQLRKAGLKR